MASTSTSSAKITVSPNVRVEYVQSATPTAKIVTPTAGESGSLLAPQDQGNLQEEIQVTPVSALNAAGANAASLPIQYNFLNPRVFGVVIGLVFLWIYVKGLRKGK